MIQRAHRWAPLLAVLLLAGITLAANSRPNPDQAVAFHKRAAAAIADMPTQVGPWLGVDVSVPDAAIDLLRPNAIRARAFRNLKTGQQATLLVVQCKDARDLAGHYPPICYPANGWVITDTEKVTWHAGGMDLPGKRYAMSFAHPTAPQRQVVANFMIMPDGQILRDMAGVRYAASNYTQRFYGAAQIQVVLRAGLTHEQENKTIHALLQGHADLIKTLASGIDSKGNPIP